MTRCIAQERGDIWHYIDFEISGKCVFLIFWQCLRLTHVWMTSHYSTSVTVLARFYSHSAQNEASVWLKDDVQAAFCCVKHAKGQVVFTITQLSVIFKMWLCGIRGQMKCGCSDVSPTASCQMYWHHSLSSYAEVPSCVMCWGLLVFTSSYWRVDINDHRSLSVLLQAACFLHAYSPSGNLWTSRRKFPKWLDELMFHRVVVWLKWLTIGSKFTYASKWFVAFSITHAIPVGVSVTSVTVGCHFQGQPNWSH